MKPFVVDTSAIVAYMFREKGWEDVEKYLEYPFISSVNYSEVVTVVLQSGIKINSIDYFLQSVPLQIIDFDEQQAVIAAELRSKTKSKGLSLGDRACLSLAIMKKIPVVTADKIWSKLSVGVDIKLVR